MSTLVLEKNVLKSDMIEKFVLGGKSNFTIINESTGKRFTFKVNAKKDVNGKVSIFFVKLLTGTDNENSYSYLGFINPKTKTYIHGNKSTISKSAQSNIAFDWLWTRIQSGKNLPESVKVLHNGKCASCGRNLTVPSSIESGFGPECSKKYL